MINFPLLLYEYRTGQAVQLVEMVEVDVEQRQQTARRSTGWGCHFCPTSPGALRRRCCCLHEHQYHRHHQTELDSYISFSLSSFSYWLKLMRTRVHTYTHTYGRAELLGAISRASPTGGGGNQTQQWSLSVYQGKTIVTSIIAQVGESNGQSDD